MSEATDSIQAFLSKYVNPNEVVDFSTDLSIDALYGVLTELRELQQMRDNISMAIAQDDTSGLYAELVWEDCITLAKRLTKLGYKKEN